MAITSEDVRSSNTLQPSQPSTVARITVFVATCQMGQPSDSSVFKPMKFQTIVTPTAQIETLQYFLLQQWEIMKHPYSLIPPMEHFYTFRGRILKMNGTLDTYCKSSIKI